MKPVQRLQQLRPSYIREILAAATEPGMLSLAGGLPAESLFPMPLLQQAAAQALAEPAAFQYSRTEGDPQLLSKLASRFGCRDDQLLLTSGSQQGLDLIARAYLNPGDKVLVETPCYLGALQVFELAGAEILTVPQTATGPDLGALEAVLGKHRPKLFYAVPDFHNPTGVCWSLPTRQRVAQLLEHYAVALIEDAPYRDLRYSAEALPMMGALTHATVLALHSFSKTVAPGLRLGVVQGEPELLEPLKRCKQACDLHSSVPSQRILSHLLDQSELFEHHERIVSEYRKRRDSLAAALRHLLGDQLDFLCPDGGMFLWCGLQQGSAERVAKRCLAEKLCVVPGYVFYPDGKGIEALRLNFSHATPAQLEEAVSRLANALQHSC